ncbi:MAG: hypothetical protein EP349_00380 [Alphaproteobacteria bacterium]|nr:MAG: hypothetical protein EP349_00380 [Alphaproteobacteria bacterium]
MTDMIEKIARPLGMAFAAAAICTAAAADEPVSQIDPVGLWKVNRFDIVMSIEDCDAQDFCPVIHWIAEDEREVYDYFGPSSREKRERGIKNPTRDNILELCGQQIDFELEQNPQNPLKYEGRVHLTGKGFWANMKLELKDEDTAAIKMSKLWVTEHDTWTRIPQSQKTRYTRCAPQRPAQL